MASVDERTALARTIQSEAGNQTLPERRAVAWVTRNMAAHRGKTIAELVCSPTCGHGGGKRFASSAKEGLARDYDLADEVLAADTSEDPTHGAINSFEPALQDRLYEDGRYTESADEIRASWGTSMQLYAVIGRWELYGLKGRRGAVVRTPGRPGGTSGAVRGRAWAPVALTAAAVGAAGMAYVLRRSPMQAVVASVGVMALGTVFAFWTPHPGGDT